MSRLHLRDHDGTIVGCSEAFDLHDMDGGPIGRGLCNCFPDSPPTIVDVPMPVMQEGWLICADFTFTNRPETP